MDIDRTEYEPEEYDPEAEFEDPDSDTLTIPRVEPPEVDVPEVDIPEVDTPESEVPRELRQGFWSLILVLNAAILMLSLAPMVLFFWRSLYHAGVLFVGGAVLMALAYRRYRKLRSMDFETPDTAAEAGESDRSNDDSRTNS